jgi:hypothetical protein
MQPVCYLSTPFGQKYGIDFDRLFETVIRPAVEAAGLECKRADDFAGGILHKSVLSLILGSEVMIADVTNGNANVMYELGIRSVASRAGAILISERGNRLPWNIAYMRVVMYDRHEIETGGVRFRDALTDAVREHVRVRHPGPIYEFFPNLEVRLPEELQSQPKKHSWFGRTWLLRDGVAVPSMETRSPEQVTDMIADLPRSARKTPEMTRLLALAINRRGELADRDRAIELLTKILEEHGPDPETLATLGRILKDRYADTHDPESRETAIAAFVAAYRVNPRDFYSGVNALLLLAETEQSPSSQKAIVTLLPMVRDSVRTEGDREPLDFWRVSAALTLAVLARDWDESRLLAEQLKSAQNSEWMLHLTRDQLRQTARLMTGRDQKRAESVLRSIET